jgi:hypothetical protein
MIDRKMGKGSIDIDFATIWWVKLMRNLTHFGGAGWS